MSRAAERLRRMRTERCPLDLAHGGPLLTLTIAISEGAISLRWVKLGAGHVYRCRLYYYS